MKNVIMTSAARKQFRKLDRGTQMRVTEALAKLAHYPAVAGVKALKNRKGEYRLRVGEYRIIFEVHEDILVIRIQHRRDVYDR